MYIYIRCRLKTEVCVYNNMRCLVNKCVIMAVGKEKISIRVYEYEIASEAMVRDSPNR